MHKEGTPTGSRRRVIYELSPIRIDKSADVRRHRTAGRGALCCAHTKAAHANQVFLSAELLRGFNF